MEQTWTISGVCGHWQLTATLKTDEETRFAADQRDTASALGSLEPHFYTIVNLIETKTLWDLEEQRHR